MNLELPARFEPYLPRPSRPPTRLPELWLRQAHEGDLKALARLYADYEGCDERLAHERLSCVLQRGRLMGRDQVTVAVSEGQLVGYGKCSHFNQDRLASRVPPPEGWYLTGVVVEPAARRRGVGSALVAHRLAWLSRMTDRVFYVASEHNLTSIELHRHFGFVERTRRFQMPGARFERNDGVLFEARIARRPSGRVPRSY